MEPVHAADSEAPDEHANSAGSVRSAHHGQSSSKLRMRFMQGMRAEGVRANRSANTNGTNEQPSPKRLAMSKVALQSAATERPDAAECDTAMSISAAAAVSSDDSSDPADESCYCKLCRKKFANLREVLSHELQVHIETVNVLRKPAAKQHGAGILIAGKTKSTSTASESQNIPVESTAGPARASQKRKGRSTTARAKPSETIESALRCEFQLRSALRACSVGDELATIFTHFRRDREELNALLCEVKGQLECELGPYGLAEIYPFGSMVTGLDMNESDIDFYIVPWNGGTTRCPTKGNTGPTYLQRKALNTIIKVLHRSTSISNIMPIRKARVPIVKCVHTRSGVSIDINVSCPSSVENSNFLRDLLRCDDRVQSIIVFLKIWAKQQQMLGRNNMTSYCFIILVIFYLQQPEGLSLLPPVEQLQRNESRNFIGGVNYAHNWATNMSPLPTSLSVIDVIKGFFAFYKDFDFENFLIAPFLGKRIPIREFTSGTYVYPAYEEQMSTVAAACGEPPDPIQLNRSMCVQDLFSLCHNVAKAILAPNLQKLRRSLAAAHHICTNANLKTDEQIYVTLLFSCSVVKGLLLKVPQSCPSTSSTAITSTTTGIGPLMSTQISGGKQSALTYSFIPKRTEIRAIASYHLKQSLDNNNLYRLWVHHYIEAICQLISEIYLIDMQVVTEERNDSQKCLESEACTKKWLLSGQVDMWTERLHQRINGQTVMDLQRAQTETFRKARHANPAYAVQLHGTLVVNIAYDKPALELHLTPHDPHNICVINKKDPLRKFFNMFKCSIQSYNLKEKLLAMTATN